MHVGAVNSPYNIRNIEFITNCQPYYGQLNKKIALFFSKPATIVKEIFKLF